MAYVKKPHPRAVETRPFKVKSQYVKAASPKPNTKVKGKTAKLK